MRIFSDRATYDGVLNLGLLGRTLDELNSQNRAFLALASPSVLRGRQDLAGDSLVVGKSSILFALEIVEGPVGTPLPGSGHINKAQYHRLAVRLSVQDYLIEGYVHTADRIDILGRLNQVSRPFIALTRATVVGPDTEVRAPFLAVNLPHVASAQTAFRVDAILEEGAGQVVSSPAGSKRG